MRNEYIRPVADVIVINTKDIITTSETFYVAEGAGDIYNLGDIFGA